MDSCIPTAAPHTNVPMTTIVTLSVKANSTTRIDRIGRTARVFAPYLS
ncbi:Uncharacterised protein [Mycobacterium tuberculosis]|nr:Uncharacterised protein [Mycobacterium tuberculosis]CPA76705.1 Uncharacterised protein [Mycobacterium tuberculosis]